MLPWQSLCNSLETWDSPWCWCLWRWRCMVSWCCPRASCRTWYPCINRHLYVKLSVITTYKNLKIVLDSFLKWWQFQGTNELFWNNSYVLWKQYVSYSNIPMAAGPILLSPLVQWLLKACGSKWEDLPSIPTMNRNTHSQPSGAYSGYDCNV